MWRRTWGEDGTLVNAQHLPVEITEPGGAVWRHTYDDRGNLLTTTDPLGAETRYGYDERGHTTAVTDALGHTVRLTPNAAGLPVAFQDELGATTTVRRDAFGRAVEVTDPLGHTTRTGWTVEGRAEWRVRADGSRESWVWDGEGNLLSHTDAVGRTTRHTVNHFGAPVTRTGPDGGVYTFTHDTELRLTAVVNPQGRSWTYVYDEVGRLTTETDYDGRTMSYGYDAAGNLAARSNGEGQTLHFTRDMLGRVTERRSTAGEATSYTYAPSGQILRAVNADADIVCAYDARGRLLSERVNGRTTTYAYDLLGRRTRRTTPSGLTSTWTYDPAGRPVGLDVDGGSLTFAYDSAGRETERRLGDGATLLQTWDAVDRLTAQSARTGVGTPAANPAVGLLQHRTYTYRADGRLTESRDLASGTRRYHLDAAGRVTAVSAHGWSETYAYDTIGNLARIAAPGHASPGERTFDGTLIRRADRTTYRHDAQGRLVRRTHRLLNGQKRVWAYTWNAEDRLSTVETPQGETWRYTYDPLGRRTSKQRLTDDGSAIDRTDFVWDGTCLAEQRTATGRVSTWDYAPGTHRPVTQTDHRPLVREPGVSLLAQLAVDDDADRVPRFHAVITDPIGTPTELVTAGGDLAWQHRSTLWGVELPAPESPESNDETACPLRFPGQYADRETGLHYNYFRYYDPETGRYCSPDPLGISPSPHPYAYVDDPNTFGDILGLTCRPGNLEDARQRNPRLAHTLDEHVNVSPQRARELAQQKGGPNGVFHDQQTAQQVVDYAIAGNPRRIANWLRKGTDQELPLTGRFGANNPLGWAAHADGSITQTGNSYTVVLQRQPGAPGGYIVKTAYPR
ncbi:RHS repeat-associated core domain-containing protein [Streptomyces sp. NPDC048192]|uniref:RHS repeat-associated core domain-containing protein n=1 Tax=Streptomyces sp. NPDC048192 TaxID=3365510 RepID=UPI00370FF9B3